MCMCTWYHVIYMVNDTWHFILDKVYIVIYTSIPKICLIHVYITNFTSTPVLYPNKLPMLSRIHKDG